MQVPGTLWSTTKKSAELVSVPAVMSEYQERVALKRATNGSHEVTGTSLGTNKKSFSEVFLLSLSESQRFVALGLVYRRSLLTASCTDLLNLCVVAIWVTYSCRYSTGKVVGQCSYPTGSSTCSDHSSTLFLLSISHLRL